MAVLAAGLLAGVVAGGAQSASAHDYLVSTNPAADSTVTEALTTVSLTFNEPPLADSSAAIAIEVHDPSGANVASGPVEILNSTLSIDVAPVTPGAYTVLWQNVSADGHTVSGEFGFEYAGPAGGAPSASAPGTPTTGPVPPTSTPAVTGTPPASTASPTAGDDGGGVQVPLLLVGVGSALGVVVVVGVVLLVVLLRRRRRSDP